MHDINVYKIISALSSVISLYNKNIADRLDNTQFLYYRSIVKIMLYLKCNSKYALIL